MSYFRAAKRYHIVVLFLSGTILVGGTYFYSSASAQNLESRISNVKLLVPFHGQRIAEFGRKKQNVVDVINEIETVLTQRRLELKESNLRAADGNNSEKLSRRSRRYIEIQELETQLFELRLLQTNYEGHHERLSNAQTEIKRAIAEDERLLIFLRASPFGLGVLLVLVFFGIRRRLAEFIGSRIPGNLCTRCEYDLTGNQSGVCPECGTVVAREADARAYLQN